LATHAFLGTPADDAVLKELYRKVLHAAASPPVVFPRVEIDGHLFGDAVVRENLLLIGLLGAGSPRQFRTAAPGQVYVIVNGKAPTPPDALPDALGPIAGGALNAILNGRMDTSSVPGRSDSSTARSRCRPGRPAR